MKTIKAKNNYYLSNTETVSARIPKYAFEWLNKFAKERNTKISTILRDTIIGLILPEQLAAELEDNLINANAETALEDSIKWYKKMLEGTEAILETQKLLLGLDEYMMQFRESVTKKLKQINKKKEDKIS